MTKQLLGVLTICLVFNIAKAADRPPRIERMRDLLEILKDPVEKERYFPGGEINYDLIPNLEENCALVSNTPELADIYCPGNKIGELQAWCKKRKKLPKVKTMDHLLEILQNPEEHEEYFCTEPAGIPNEEMPEYGSMGIIGKNLPRVTRLNLPFVLAHKELCEKYWSGPGKIVVEGEYYERPPVVGEGSVGKAIQFFGLQKRKN